MNRNSTVDSAVTLLGSFFVDGGSGICVIIDWQHTARFREFDGYQILMPEEYGYGPLPAGLATSIMLPATGDIPVYAEYDDVTVTRIVVALDQWVAVGQQASPMLTPQDDSQGAHHHRRDLLGHVTATAGALLVTEIDSIILSHEYDDDSGNQIIVPSEGDNDFAFHAGIRIDLGDSNKTSEYPVYGIYESNRLVRLIVEIA